MMLPGIFGSKPTPRRHPMADEKFDADQFSHPVQKLVLCAPPRTASTYLTALLRTASLGVPEEYFGLHVERDIRARTGLKKKMSKYGTDRSYFDKILELRTINGLFAVKLQYWQLQRVARSRLAGDLFDGAATVFLTRDKVVDQAVSQAVAVLTQRWSDSPETGNGTISPTDRQLRLAYYKALRFVLREREGFERFFALAGVEPLRFSTEQLTKQPLAHTQQVAEHLGRSLQDRVLLNELIENREPQKVDAAIKQRLKNEIVPALPGFELLEQHSGKSSVFSTAQRSIVNFVFRRQGRIS